MSLRVPIEATDSPPPHLNAGATAAGCLVDAMSGRYYRITDVDSLPPFLVNLVSASDQWMFIASNGALTAGRGDADHALFPYQTADRMYDSAGAIGPFSAIAVSTAEGDILWEPFAPHALQATPSITRTLYKSVEGDRICFEEVNADLGLAFRYSWATADNHGFIRRCELENLTARPVSLRVLDGLRNLLPPGVSQRLQATSSNLADAYKTAELLPDSPLAVYALAAAIVDQPTAIESLRACAVWSSGLQGKRILLSDSQIGRFLAGEMPSTETHRRGVRCSYLMCAHLNLAARRTERWCVVADTGLSQADVAERRAKLESGSLARELAADADEATLRLRAMVAAADGLQCGGDETMAAHHFANVLFNILRGGVFADGHRLPGPDFAAFVAVHNRAAAARHAGFLAQLPSELSRADLLVRVIALADPDLRRLASEYLPLMFSRRHGDPSRPWNRFRIRLRDSHGGRLLAYEGNWRDIFQNWEALCLSHPEFLDAVVAKFLNASTADGYNPYRISQAGIDWECPDPEDPWASIGYWGDHQVNYLLKLLEWASRHRPEGLRASLRESRYSYARVPYRIAPYTAMRRDPRATITFDADLDRTINERLGATGADARLVTASDGGVLHVNLTEKLLVVVLVRLTNFVPGGGIWMNTQRPEWNDANNALVGYGVSMVTLCYLRRLLSHCRTTLLPALGSRPVPVSSAVAELAETIGAILSANHPRPVDGGTTDDSTRRALLDALAEAGSDYRTRIYTEGPGAPVDMVPAGLLELFDRALDLVDQSIRENRREDGLYHSYNQLEFSEQPEPGVRIHRLQAMLEGQVAVLSAGRLSPGEVVGLLEALRRSDLFRADQHSYTLYPDRVLPGFLERNTIPEDAWISCPLFPAMEADGETRLVERDVSGISRFHADLVNEEALETRMTLLAADARWTSLVAQHADRVREIYELVFRHRAFTGRSGSMFGYEGLGCIYWHMVAKLLLAVQENLLAAQDVGAPEVSRLTELYYDIRAGLGFNKTPAEYGAFPTDPYSHTPSHSGAQQPGMTGQVKEEILTRFGELGVHVSDGRVAFLPTFLRAREFTSGPVSFRAIGPDGRETVIALPADALAFTYCGTPIVYRRTTGVGRLVIFAADGSRSEQPGHTLDAAGSAALFARDASLARIEVELGAGHRPLA